MNLVKQLSVEEGNKIIAEFHGWVHYDTPKGKGKGYWSFPSWGKAHFDSGSFKYHSSWDWLMPVVEKIEDLRFQVKQCRRKVEIWKDTSKGHSVTMPSTDILFTIKKETKLQSTWLAVLEFINWYNAQQKTNV